MLLTDYWFTNINSSISPAEIGPAAIGFKPPNVPAFAVLVIGVFTGKIMFENQPGQFRSREVEDVGTAIKPPVSPRGYYLLDLTE